MGDFLQIIADELRREITLPGIKASGVPVPIYDGFKYGTLPPIYPGILLEAAPKSEWLDPTAHYPWIRIVVSPTELILSHRHAILGYNHPFYKIMEGMNVDLEELRLPLADPISLERLHEKLNRCLPRYLRRMADRRATRSGHGKSKV